MVPNPDPKQYWNNWKNDMSLFSATNQERPFEQLLSEKRRFSTSIPILCHALWKLGSSNCFIFEMKHASGTCTLKCKLPSWKWWTTNQDFTRHFKERCCNATSFLTKAFNFSVTEHNKDQCLGLKHSGRHWKAILNFMKRSTYDQLLWTERFRIQLRYCFVAY